MMHTVMTGCNQYIFKNTQVSDQSCMNEERVESMYRSMLVIMPGEANNRQNRPKAGSYKAWKT
jgi:hypothetical protein